MATYTHTAEDVINAVIQDSQAQTTNRTALLDYVNRTSLRILRESQWVFLQSGYQKFITQMGVDKYYFGSGTAPNGTINVNLNIANAESVLPESVYDLSDAVPLSQTPETARFGQAFLRLDGTTRLGRPRGYACYQQEQNVIHIFPPPDNQNYYYPVPEPSALSLISGGSLPTRTYFVSTSFEDTVGGEGLPGQAVPYVIPVSSLLVVNPPIPEVPSALSPQYTFYNVYIAFTQNGQLYKQNATPIPIGMPWVEPTVGAMFYPAIPDQLAIAAPSTQLYLLTVTTGGILQTAPTALTYTVSPIYLLDTLLNSWNLGIDNLGNLNVTEVPFLTGTSNVILQDSNSVAWQLSVNGLGQLVTTSLGPVGSLPSVFPLSAPTLAPLEGYIIGFRYQQVKRQITQSTDLLQIPDAYFDVVVAGVNYYCSLYLDRSTDENFRAPVWKREFMDGLAQIRRDLRINYRNSDFIAPDRISQADPNKSTWAWIF